MAEKQLRCSVCRITEKKVMGDPLRYGTKSDRNHYLLKYGMDVSFRLSQDGKTAWCPRCHKEKEIQNIFDAIDRRKNV